MNSTTDFPASDDAACYPSDSGWWWAEASDGSFIPINVEKRGPRQVLSVCIPRCSTHCDKWWRPLKAIKGKWRGRVQIPLDNVKSPSVDAKEKPMP
jgi:hypothetical protein